MIKKVASNVGASFVRVVQKTEEKIGNVGKTTYDPYFLNLSQKAEQTTKSTEKMLKCLEAMLQPNPALRAEEFTLTKVERKKDKLTLSEELGHGMIEAGTRLGPCSTYGEALMKAGRGETKLGRAEKALIASATTGFIAPLRKFLDEDMKTIERELKLLENRRLDLDAAKMKVRRQRADPARRAAAEADVAAAQSSFDKQMEKTKVLLEKMESYEVQHVQCLKELINSQLTYHAKCHHLIQELLDQLAELAKAAEAAEPAEPGTPREPAEAAETAETAETAESSEPGDPAESAGPSESI